MSHLTVLLGRPLGGFLFEAGPAFPFLADVFSFIVSVGTLLTLRGKGEVTFRPVSESSSLKEIGAGIKWVFRDPFARFAVLLGSLMTFIAQALIIIIMSYAEARHLPSAEIGFALAASGVGGILGAIMGMRLNVSFKHSRTLIQSLICVLALLVVLVAIRSGTELCAAAVILLLLSFAGAMSNIGLDAYVAQWAPGALARVTSVARLMSFVACATGPVVGGFLAGTWGTYPTIVVLFSATLALIILARRVRSIRLAQTAGRRGPETGIPNVGEDDGTEPETTLAQDKSENGTSLSRPAAAIS